MKRWTQWQLEILEDKTDLFQTDIRQLSVLCTQYSDFLRSSAMAYRETNDELAAQAARLGMN